MFTFLKEAAQNLQIQFDTQAVMADFELALVQSLEIQFPSAVIHGCFFHFSQCLWRKVQSLGLSDQYKNDAVIRSFIKKTTALAFIPLAFVRVAWSAIKADAPGIQEADDFISYFESTWLDGNFPPRTWNYFSHEGPRTNNHLEGWHNRLKRVSRKAHPNLFEVVEILKKEQAATEVAIELLTGGGRIRSKRRKVVQHEDTIKRLRTEFTNGVRSLDAFVNSLSDCVVSFDY